MKTPNKGASRKVEILGADPKWAQETQAWLETLGVVASRIDAVNQVSAPTLIIDQKTAAQMAELRELGGSLGEIVERLKADVALMERLHRQKLPKRFPKIRGLKIESRYLVGEAAGGDHFDVAESKASSRVSVLMTDASTYGLAGTILDVIMRVAMKLSVDELKHADQFVRQIYDEVTTTLGAKDRLSVVYGLLSRADHSFEYVAVGTHRLFHAQAGRDFMALPRGQDPIPMIKKEALITTGALSLAPKDRLILVSDGFVEALGGDQAFLSSINRLKTQDADRGLTEMVYELKKTLPADDDIPKQDCSAMWIELDSNVRRIA